MEDFVIVDDVIAVDDEIIIEVPEPVVDASTAIKRAKKTKQEAFKDAVIKRFSNAPWAKKRSVTLGGAGGIGSNVAYNLIKLGYDIYLFEYDVVEASNLGGQLYFLSDISKSKASAILKRAGDVNKETKIYTCGKLLDISPDSYIQEITLSGFDNIDARRLLFEKWYAKFKDSTQAIFIDGRQNAEDFEIFAVTPDLADRYRETLFTDEIDELPCNYKATTQTGLINAGMMVGVMTNFISELDDPGIRVIPFRTSFNIPMMYVEIT